MFNSSPLKCFSAALNINVSSRVCHFITFNPNLGFILYIWVPCVTSKSASYTINYCYWNMSWLIKKSHKWCKNHENIKSFHNSYWHKLTAKMNSHTWILQTIWINYSTHLHLKKWCCWPVVHVSTVLGVDWLYSTLCLHRILSAKFLYLRKKTLWTVQFAFFELPVDLISLWCPVLVVWFRKMGN